MRGRSRSRAPVPGRRPKDRPKSRRGPVALGVLAAVSMVAACSNAPPPPVVQPAPPGSTPPPTSSTSPSTPMPVEVVAGVDKMEGGFNPHTLADLSPTSAALSSLMLPSVFRPDPQGRPQLDTTLMQSADVVPDADKFTVRYQIRKEAGWSDGGTIAAEDFVYLWQQMRSQPGVAGAAGYQLIDDVKSRQGGKTVEVTFAKPFPGWRSLFNNLLPAHLLKDDPHSWSSALDGGYPASGGPFAIRQVDRTRGEIVLERNDRYWGRPAASDRIVLRSSNQEKQVSALRSGDSHLAVFNANARTMDALRDLGDKVHFTTIPRPATMQVLLRPNTQALAEQKVRKAVIAGLDREALTNVGTAGGPAEQLRAHSQVLAPSEPGYTPTEPPGAVPQRPDPERLAQLLTEAGYERSGGTWVRNGRPLNLVIGAPFEHKQYVKIAQQAAKQLQDQGIQATAVTPTGDQLFGQMLAANPLAEDPTNSSVDMAIAPRPAGGDPAAMLDSSYGCPRSSNEQSFPTNDAGFCDELLQPTIEAAMTGRIPFRQASARVESQLWQRGIAVPLYQQAQIMAARPEVPGLQPGNGLSGPFSTAAEWVGTPSQDDGY